MPWKTIGVEEQRWRFLQEVLQQRAMGFAALCGKYGISRKTGYKWRKRLMKLGRQGLVDGSCRPRRMGAAFAVRWHGEVVELHVKNYAVGARKVRALLRRNYPGVHLPSDRTIHRWLRAAGRVHAPRRPGPQRRAASTLRGRRPNDVWTVDFKGWFYTGDGKRVQLLTVRDLASAYLLAARHLARPDERSVARCLRGLFRRHGLPKAIRVDRGAPFSGDGPRHWSRLSVGWTALGITVQVTRRARPQDNGAHEQMHRVLKADTASPPAGNLPAQQRRLDRWRHWYTHQRPHQKLHQRSPAELYRPSDRRWPVTPCVPTYPSTWPVFTVDRPGYIFWQGRRWQIGRAFHGQRVGLRRRRACFEVYFGKDLLGVLTPNDHLIHPVRLSSPRRLR